MLHRCYNPKNDSYHRYGARGIQVCQRWRDSFAAFIEDMGERPPGHTMDRIDNGGHYSPENTRWATQTQQSRNRGCVGFVTYRGRTRRVPDFCEELGLPNGPVNSRLALGWTVEDAFERPFRQKAPNRDVRVTYGSKTKPLLLWCQDLGLPYRAMYQRIFSHAWPVERAFEEPVRARKATPKKEITCHKMRIDNTPAPLQ